jgi:diadenosine tetraphosphate (Ap4A) HIT family hydrolase
MPSIFSKIVDGELPGRFVWKDDRAVAFLTIAPLKPGHTLVVPRVEVDHWQEIEPGLMQHLVYVSQGVGRAIQAAFSPERVAMMIAGLEVPHLHIHVSPIWGLSDMDFARAERSPRPEDLDSAAQKIRDELRNLGFSEVAD